MKPPIAIPAYALHVYDQLVKAGYEAYFVGGAVRDVLAGREADDFDIATSALPEQVQKVFEDSFYDNDFGMVGVIVREGEEALVVHVTTYRMETTYTDYRRPDSVSWGKRIEEDLLRRDFTINAIALSLSKTPDIEGIPPREMVPVVPDSYEITDPYHGIQDLQHKLIRAVGEAVERFNEDALRMMRAVRFHSQLGFEIEKATMQAIEEKKKQITFISGERVRDELWKILKSERAYEGIVMLDRVGLLAYILPELTAAKDLGQRGHHIYDVYVHSLQALKNCPSHDPLVRFAALLHDIGKVPAHEVREGVNTFYNHDIIGAKMVRSIAHRLHLSKKDREKLYVLVRYHMFSVDTIQTDAAVRRFIRKVGVENIEDMVDLRIGDRLGSGTTDAEGWRLRTFKERIKTLLMPTFTVKDLAIDGNDVMRILNIPPGRKIGEVLNALFEEVLDDPQKNTREYLEKRVLELN